MALDNFFEEEDEGHSLLPAGGSSGRSRQMFKDFSSKVEGFPQSFSELSWQAKLAVAVVVVTFFGLWSGHGGGRHPVGLKLRGLENGDELKWAEDTFGVFLKVAVPEMEKANTMVHNFLNFLPQGKCDDWANAFAESGTFSFNLPHLQGEFTSRREVRDAFCKDTGKQVKAIRLIWHFPDAHRYSGIALFEVFRKGGSTIQKERWAQYASLVADGKGGQPHIKEFRLYVESNDPGQLKDVVDKVVQANIRRLDSNDCAGFEAALPAAGTENWVMQTLPAFSLKQPELNEKPRDQILAMCRSIGQGDWKTIDFQYASVTGVFPSARDREVMIFFHKEKRYKGCIDVTDDPEAVLVKLNSDIPPQVHTLIFYYVEGVHLVEEWAWRYGTPKNGILR